MVRCPRCGHENQEGDRFCANCGARLTPVAPPRETSTEPEATAEPGDETARPAPAPPRPTSFPPPVTPSFAEEPRGDEPGADDEWRMSSLGPPPPPKRRLWLWIVIGIFAALLICCVASIIFFTATDTGQQLWQDAVSTAEAIQTEQAGN